MWILESLLKIYIVLGLIVLGVLYLAFLSVSGLLALVAELAQPSSWPVSGKRWRCGSDNSRTF